MTEPKIKFGPSSAHEQIFSGVGEMNLFRYWRNGPRGAELKAKFSAKLFEIYGAQLGISQEGSDRLFELAWNSDSSPRRIEHSYVIFSELISEGDN